MAPKLDGVEVLRIVLPGDEVLQFNPDEQCIFIGPGLRWQENVICATRSGVLKKTSKNLYYVDTRQKRYIPHKKEFVVGTVQKKMGNNYIIDIGGSEQATISDLVFENFSKKTGKKMKPGDLIFGQLLVANKDMEPELVCIDVFNSSVGIGSLPDGGIVFTLPLHVARLIANPQNSLLLIIARRLKYTILVGFNGRVWLKARRQREMVAIMNCLKMLEVMTLEEVEANVHRFLDSLLLH
ncbi:exosome complex component RRP40 [Procambarus clarkii]|uniref:exosome complex component RRP40 n=1 Tax=Procambarus clarkii TaxID=6728 RepID=UPI0037441958